MRVRFKGEADGLPCEVYGYHFPVGEWVHVEGLALKLATNTMFEVDDGEGEDKPHRVVRRPKGDA